jgi:hypothetical protein
MEEERLSLANLEGGAAVEMFDIALQKVLENIHDINTTADAREIILKVKVRPMEGNRSIIFYSIDCSSKMSGQETVKGVADMRVEGGKLSAFGRVQKQAEMPFSNVSPINQPTE